MGKGAGDGVAQGGGEKEQVMVCTDLGRRGRNGKVWDGC